MIVGIKDKTWAELAQMRLDIQRGILARIVELEDQQMLDLFEEFAELDNYMSKQLSEEISKLRGSMITTSLN